MNITDIENGSIVKIRNKQKGMVIDDEIIFNYRKRKINRYRNNMKFKKEGNSYEDIVVVYKKIQRLDLIHEDFAHIPIWIEEEEK